VLCLEVVVHALFIPGPLGLFFSCVRELSSGAALDLQINRVKMRRCRRRLSRSALMGAVSVVLADNMTVVEWLMRALMLGCCTGQRLPWR